MITRFIIVACISNMLRVREYFARCHDFDLRLSVIKLYRFRAENPKQSCLANKHSVCPHRYVFYLPIVAKFPSLGPGYVYSLSAIYRIARSSVC